MTADTLALAIPDPLQGLCISKGADCQVAAEVKSVRKGKGADGAVLSSASWLDKRQLLLLLCLLPWHLHYKVCSGFWQGVWREHGRPRVRRLWGRLACLWYTRRYAVSGHTCHAGAKRQVDVSCSGAQTRGPPAAEVTTLQRALYRPRHSGNANFGHFCRHYHFDKLPCMLNCCVQAFLRHHE